MAADVVRKTAGRVEPATSVKERVAEHLRRLIQRGQLRPGHRLPTERDLAAELGVSRPSVRAAIQSLEAIGVLHARRRAGTFIQGGPPTLDSQPLALLAALHDFTSEEMFEARAALETVAAGLCARRATPEQRLVMADAVAGMFASVTDPQAFLVHDVRFHQAVAAGSNNPVMATLVNMVATLVYERRRATIERARDLRESADIHQRIYQAIMRRHASAARAAMGQHLRLALDGWAAEDRVASGETPPSPRRRRRRAGDDTR
jgi:GntR family transcriptional repressor for pyruvate dehydrogenase complex